MIQMRLTMMTFLSFSRSNRAGLTLLEMLIVLLILAILAGAAVRSLQPVADQARFEATLKSLQAIDNAYFSTSQDSNEASQVSGFIADVGRPPIEDSSFSTGPLTELWIGPTSEDDDPLPDFDLHESTIPVETDIQNAGTIFIAAGWRGPYLDKPIGESELLDGWGNQFIYLFQTTTVNGDPYTYPSLFKSPGADGNPNTSVAPYDRSILNPKGSWSPAKITGRFAIEVTIGERPLSELENLRLIARIYGPRNGIPVKLNELVLNNLAVGVNQLEISDSMFVGPKTIRVFLDKTFESGFEVEPNTEVILYRSLKPGVNTINTISIP